MIKYILPLLLLGNFPTNINSENTDKCRVRACWFGPQGKECTDWVEIPCDTEVILIPHEDKEFTSF